MANNPQDLIGRDVVMLGAVARTGDDQPIKGAISSGRIVAVYPDGRVVIKTNSIFHRSPFTTRLVLTGQDGWQLAGGDQ